MDHESEKCGFRSDLMNPGKWILQMNNPFSDFSKETQNPLLDTRIRIWIFPKKRTLSEFN